MKIDAEKGNELPSGVDVQVPDVQTAAVVFASPHSGRDYPEPFVRQSQLDPLVLRRSEDAFIDEIFMCAPKFGAPFVCAHFPRAYVDVNRRPWELDPYMFKDDLPAYIITQSPRITAGLGTIPKIVANNHHIYDHKLNFEDARRRIKTHYHPYHHALQTLISNTVQKFSGCLLIDCHSMPSSGIRSGDPLSDIVIGDLQGTSCSRDVVDLALSTFRNFGYSAALNKPYAGGYTTQHYGQPGGGIHTLQIEINRALYMDEKRITKNPYYPKLASDIRGLIESLTAIDPALLAPSHRHLPKAAE